MLINFYKNLMPDVAADDFLFEKTPRYIAESDIPERIYNFYKNYSTFQSTKISNDLQNLKFIVVLCDPSKRAYSDYVHTLAHNFKFIKDQLTSDFEDFDDFSSSFS